MKEPLVRSRGWLGGPGDPATLAPGTGSTGSFAWEPHKEDSDFLQAGDLYRLISKDEKNRLVANIAGTLSRVTRDEIAEKSISHFKAADKGFGDRLSKAVKALRQRG